MRFTHIFISVIATLMTAGCGSSANQPAHKGTDEPIPTGDVTYAPSRVVEVLDRQQEAAFRFFYDGADPTTGMIYEGTERGECITTGGTGFGIMALCVGVERGWITRKQGTDRILKIISFLTNCERYHGAWSHWYNKDGTYMAFGKQKATGDLVETSFVMQGLLAASEYFSRDNDAESRLRESVENLYNTVEWSFYTGNEGKGLYWLWYSGTNTYELIISGWNEALTTYLMALGAHDDNAIDTEIYRKGWGETAYRDRSTEGYSLPLGSQGWGGPLFFTHYSFLGYNPKLMMDDKCWYFQQNQAHAMLNRHHCLYKAPGNFGYTAGLWGLTACYGAGTTPGYSARDPRNDDGVIAPTAALSSMPYTPFYSIQVLIELDRLNGTKGKYGFGDSYKPAENAAEKRILAIDQGPIVIMIENYRSGLVWDLLMKNKHARKGLEKAGIHEPKLPEGFVGVMPDSETTYCDLIQHPDRKMYEIDYSLDNAGRVTFGIRREDSKDYAKEFTVNATAGISSVSFDAERITRGVTYIISMTVESGQSYMFKAILH